MNYKIIAMDFDGTLLNEKKEVTERTKYVLTQCKDKGYIIVGVTARAFNSVKSVVPLDIFNYLILNNGTYVYDVKNEEGYCTGKIDKSESLKIVNKVESFSNKIGFVSPTSYYAYKYNSPHIINIDNINDIKEDIVRMNIFLSDREDIDRVRNNLNSSYNNIHCFVMQDSNSIERWLVVNPKGVDKKTTLEKLGEKLGITLEEIIFFGDGLNDLPVMGKVGCSVAMGNALDEVKEKCNEVTLSNNEDGIAVTIQEKILKNCE